MKFENTEVWGFKHALRGMRNPMNSWDRSDSNYCEPSDKFDCDECIIKNMSAEGRVYRIGEKDLELAQKLIVAGKEHRKFMRQIFVSVDITAPLYWWKEFDTYKIGTTANSTSTMHKLATTPITLSCFETDDYNPYLTVMTSDEYHENDLTIDSLMNQGSLMIDVLEKLRVRYLETKDKKYFKELVRWLPESWLQTRTVTMNYENIRSIYVQRKNHKLSEWSNSFISWIRGLPYSDEMITYGIDGGE